MAEDKLAIVLAGPGRDVVFNVMIPAFSDPRFTIMSTVLTPDTMQGVVGNMQPDLLVIYAVQYEPNMIIATIKQMQQWNGTTFVVMPESMRPLMGTFANLANTTAYVSAQIVWAEMAGLAYSATQTNRARVVAAAPAQFQSAQVLSGAGMPAPQAVATGTKRIAVIAPAGGAGASTVAEGLAYEMAVRMSVRSYLFSLGMPPAAVSHLSAIKYSTGLVDYFSRPGRDTFKGAIQTTERLDVVVAPESSHDYLSIAARSGSDAHAPGSIFAMLRDSDDGQHAAMVMDLPSSENAWMIHPLLFANTILLVVRLNVADLFAARHMLSVIYSDPQFQRESVFLVLNQMDETNSLTARQFNEELANNLGSAPQVCAIIERDPAVVLAQNARQPAVLKSEKLAKGIRQITAMLFPGMASTASAANGSDRSRLRLPKIKLG